MAKRKDRDKGSSADANRGGDGSAAPFVPKTTSLRVLSAAAQECRGCDLYKTATQVVFGGGPGKARVIFVGEQPGDQEDRQGAPFVGPAGAMLDKALENAGIRRSDVYLTNAVKHFKWEPRGKRRIHKKPRMSEIKACRPWLEAELRAIKPRIVVCSSIRGAARARFGRTTGGVRIAGCGFESGGEGVEIADLKGPRREKGRRRQIRTEYGRRGCRSSDR